MQQRNAFSFSNHKGSIINWFLNEIWNERINEVYTVSYINCELKILIKMLKSFIGRKDPIESCINLFLYLT